MLLPARLLSPLKEGKKSEGFQIMCSRKAAASIMNMSKRGNTGDVLSRFGSGGDGSSALPHVEAGVGKALTSR